MPFIATDLYYQHILKFADNNFGIKAIDIHAWFQSAVCLEECEVAPVASALWEDLGKQGDIELKTIFFALRLVGCTKYDVPSCLEAVKNNLKFLVLFFWK